MKKILFAVLSTILLSTISCKEGQKEENEINSDLEDECLCCDNGSGEIDPNSNFAVLLSGSPIMVKLNDEFRDEWLDMDIKATYDGESGGTITVKNIPEGGEAVWMSGDYTIHSCGASFKIGNGIDRTIEATESKITISFEIGTNNRLASYEGEWVFEW